MSDTQEYLKKLARRSRETKVYAKFQLDGLEIAKILGDEAHKSLYIRLAKKHNPDFLRRLARGIAENPRVQNKGAYFMNRLQASNHG